MVDIFDTRFEDQDVDVDNFVALGDEVNINEKDPTLKRILIGSGWDTNAFNADVVDADISLFLLNNDEMTRIDEDFVFYNQKEANNGAIRHHGDSRTGAGDGDDETISVFLEGVPFDVMQIMIVLTIYRGFEKEQNVSMIRNAYIRIVNEENNYEIVRYKLDPDIKDRTETGVLAATLNREGPKWHFKPLAEFYPNGLPEIASKYGIIVKEQ
ncbi:MAG: TerD family protein [Bdellovibrionales bacterium]